jgi:hypothetical protein
MCALSFNFENWDVADVMAVPRLIAAVLVLTAVSRASAAANCNGADNP